VISEQTWNNVTGKNQKQVLFEKNPGLKVVIPNNATIWTYLNLFITDKITDLIVMEINRNSNQVLGKCKYN